uniref:Uncharacterized protein n=1 Tax=Avena sativa TaxID=4498 RepID=A0ACD5WKL5_AVESA
MEPPWATTAAETGQGTTPPLPNEILTEILARLPAKSIGRFRAVSREWCAMLSSASFVGLHARLANALSRRRPRLLLTPARSPSYDGYVYSWRPGGPFEKLMRDDLRLGCPIPNSKPCHGLILIRCTNKGGYLVCNPSTGTMLALPDTYAPLKLTVRQKSVGARFRMPLFWEVCYGLGYCSVTRKHKVVRIFSNLSGSASTCEVLVLDAPAYWRPAAQQPPSYYVDENNPAVFVNGYLHFFSHEAGITTFNTTSETLGLLKLPRLDWQKPLLTELDGCLCFCTEEPGSNAHFLVFLLRDHVEARWEKLCCIDRSAWPESERRLLQSLCIAPLCMYHSDDGRKKIMFGTGTLKVFVVDPDSVDVPEILFTPDGTIIGSCDDGFYLMLGLFEEHLGPVGRTIEEMVFSSPTTKAWSDVLKWMSARSVSELSLVCREWRAMIMTDRFVQSHAIYANLNKSPRVMIILDARYGLYVDLKDFSGSWALVNDPDLLCSQPCHGLNVGSSGIWDFVCNPAMGYCQHIDIETPNDDETFFAGRIGMGYDSSINKHVLVHISYKMKDLVTREYKLECKLQYVNEKLWHMVDAPPRPVADMPPAYVNGKICWMAEPNLGPVSLSCKIVAFNVDAGKFEIMEGPPCSHNNGRMFMLQLRGALCVACSDKSSNVIDIWMMQDNGSWSMEYHIELSEFLPDYSSDNTTPLAIDPNDGRILLNTGRSLGYYNPKMVALETIFRVDKYSLKFCPIICEESLVCPLGPL